MSETFGEARERLKQDIERLPRLPRLILRYRMRKLERRLAKERRRVFRATQ